MRKYSRLAMFAALALGTACGIPDEGPAMQPGNDCLSCHNGDTAPAWTVAGTVFADPNAPAYGGEAAADIIVTDSAQRTITLKSNSAGNFYTAEALAFPISVKVQRGSYVMQMGEAPASGSCNSCHTVPPGDPDAPGRLFVPYQDISRLGKR